MVMPNANGPIELTNAAGIKEGRKPTMVPAPPAASPNSRRGPGPDVLRGSQADAENTVLFKELFDDALVKHGVPPAQLTLHADRGAPMKAKATAFLLADLGVTKSHSRPHTSNDNPFSEAHLQDAGISSSAIPRHRVHRGCPGLLPPLLHLVQPRSPSRRHRIDDARPGALRSGQGRPCRTPGRPGAGISG